MDALEESIDRVAAENEFSGVVRVDRDGEVVLARGYGLANRAAATPNTVDGQFAIASGTKGLTAQMIIRLVDDGRIALETTARSLLGDDLPLIADDVTVEHLLTHRSGIGDYVPEDPEIDIDDWVLGASPNQLELTEQFLAVLDGYPTAFAAGTQFTYCNSGYAVLALLAERATGESFHDLVAEQVCVPAGMVDTAFLRSDELPGRAAIGYLKGPGARTNVFHLPVRGTGDGGIYSTVSDVHAMWDAFFSGRIVSPARVAEMVRPRSESPDDEMRYGLGFWLHEALDTVMLVGYDAGVSFRTARDPGGRFTHTVISNTSTGAWPIARHLDELHESLARDAS